MSELEDLRQQVHILEKTESLATLELSAKVRRLEEDLRLASEDAETANKALDKAAEALALAEGALVELKKIDLIGPLTAEEWMEFRLRTNEDEEDELLRCCANTSAIRDKLFYLMRSYAEDPLLGRATFIRAWEAFNEHGYEDWSDRARELMDRLHAYYGCRECTAHPHPIEFP